MSTWEDIGYDRKPSEDEHDAPRPQTPISFRDWFLTQDDEMQNRVLKVFPSLKVEDWGP